MYKRQVLKNRTDSAKESLALDEYVHIKSLQKCNGRSWTCAMDMDKQFTRTRLTPMCCPLANSNTAQSASSSAAVPKCESKHHVVSDWEIYINLVCGILDLCTVDTAPELGTSSFLVVGLHWHVGYWICVQSVSYTHLDVYKRQFVNIYRKTNTAILQLLKFIACLVMLC